VSAERGVRNAEWDTDTPYALCANPKPGTRNSKLAGGFTLLEVMIAMFVFFIVVFAVLGMVVQSLGAARALQRPQPDFSILASALTLSNCLDIRCESGDFGELGDEYRDYQWERCAEPYPPGSTNEDLKIVRFVITRSGVRGSSVAEEMEILMYRKSCTPSSARPRL